MTLVERTWARGPGLCVGFSLAWALSGCGTDGGGETGSVLPTASQGSTEDSSEAEAGDDTTGATQTGVPATYRFTCIDIQQAGSAGDGDIQTNLLQTQWGADISDHKLNILVDFMTLDQGDGLGTMQIRSGIGSGDDDQCSEPTSHSSVVDVNFDSSVTAFVGNSELDTCAKAAEASDASFGTFNLTTGPEEVIYIYAEDNNGEPFNCTDNAQADAVPIHAVEAQFTLSEDEQIAHGELTGCLVEAEAETICSCLGTCVAPAEPFAQCGCNPDATPLRELLLGVTSTENCTQIMGETAFDIKIAFTASRLAAVPDTCG